MIISLDEAERIDDSIDKNDIIALEHAIFSHTNNYFYHPNYKPMIDKIEGNKIYIDGKNYFEVNDTVEIYGTEDLDGIYQVKTSEENYIELNVRIFGDYSNLNSNAHVYLIDFPPDVKAGAKEILKYRAKTDKNIGIKSKSVARMSITYANAQDAKETVNGLPAHLFDFLEPYIKMRWG